MIINDYSRIVSEENYDENIKYSLCQHYFKGYAKDKPECLGLEVLVPSTHEEYTHVVSGLEPTYPDWSVINKYFQEHPESHHCYYPYTKDELNQMIERIEYIRDNMED